MQELDWNQVVTHLYQLGIAFVLALPVAWNREQRARGAGLRTFPLVSIAACGYMLVGMQVYSGSDAEARVMHGLYRRRGDSQGWGQCQWYCHGGQFVEYRGHWHFGGLQPL